MADTLITGSPGNDGLSLGLALPAGAVTVDGGAGFDSLQLPSDNSNASWQGRIRVDLRSGEVFASTVRDAPLALLPVTVRNIEALYGGKGWEVELIGDAADNLLHSYGLGPESKLVGGPGNDTLEGATADYSATAGPVLASLAAGTASSVDGNDVLRTNHLTGSAFADRLTGDNRVNFIDGGPGDDTLDGAGTGLGLDGPDWAVYTDAPGGVNVSLAAGTASGAAGNDSLVRIGAVLGSAFGDLLIAAGTADGASTLRGAAGNDTLLGGAGSTVHQPGAGDDLVTGGSGSDTLSFADATGGVVVSIDEGRAEGAGLDRFSGIERFTGSPFADVIRGAAGNDVIDGGGGADTLSGGAGDDRLYRGGVLDGGAGNDSLSAAVSTFAGLRILEGGDGNDTLDGGEVLAGGRGDDLLSLAGGYGIGPSGNQQFLPVTPARIVHGGEGFDTVQMLPDNAAFDLGRSSRVVLDLAAGTLRIDDHPATPVAFRSIEALYDSKGWSSTFIGDAGPNLMAGSRLFGGGGDDQFLWSTAGSSVIDGQTGIDTLRLPDSRASYAREVQADSRWLWRHAGQSIHSTTSVERFVFTDQALAFGDRALEVARIAFALWSKDIAAHPALFGKGIDWYDDGRSFDEAVRYALSFFAGRSDAELAAQLAVNVPGARSAGELLALMAAHGGGTDGRAYVTSLMAGDAVNVAQVAASDFVAAGIPCALNWGNEALFLLPAAPG